VIWRTRLCLRTKKLYWRWRGGRKGGGDDLTLNELTVYVRVFHKLLVCARVLFRKNAIRRRRGFPRGEIVYKEEHQVGDSELYLQSIPLYEPNRYLPSIRKLSLLDLHLPASVPSPLTLMPPSPMTTILAAFRTVDSRWAITTTVLPT